MALRYHVSWNYVCVVRGVYVCKYQKTSGSLGEGSTDQSLTAGRQQRCLLSVPPLRP